MSESDVIVKGATEIAESVCRRNEFAEASVHLAFRRIVVHDFVDDPEPQAVKFHYRGHSKHLSPRRAA